MMNLLHWRLLVAVADAGNISRAAEEIGMTQSGASQAIAQLEASLGFPVFTRERRYIGITALGEQVVEHARNMLSQLNAIRELADQGRNVTRGRIRLASFPSVTSTFCPACCATLSACIRVLTLLCWKALTKKSKRGLPQTPLNLVWS